MFKDTPSSRAYIRLPWYAPGALVESLLFAAVQAVMLACTVLVAAQMLAYA